MERVLHGINNNKKYNSSRRIIEVIRREEMKVRFLNYSLDFAE